MCVEDRDASLQMRIDVGTGRTLESLAEYLDRVDEQLVVRSKDLVQTMSAIETKERVPVQSPATLACVGTALSKDGTPIAFDRIGNGPPVTVWRMEISASKRL